MFKDSTFFIVIPEHVDLYRYPGEKYDVYKAHFSFTDAGFYSESEPRQLKDNFTSEEINMMVYDKLSSCDIESLMIRDVWYDDNEEQQEREVEIGVKPGSAKILKKAFNVLNKEAKSYFRK